MEVLSLFRDTKAGVAPLVALAAIPLMTGIGAAVDYSRASAARTAMQNALDAAALLVSKQEQQQVAGDPTQSASDYFNANFARPDVQDVQVTAASSSQSGGSSLSMTASGSLKTLFMNVVGIPTVNISVKSGTFVAANGLGCVLSLNKAASGATTAPGSTSINLNSCSLFDNSNSSSALTVSGSATLSAFSIGVVGGVSGTAGITTTEGIRTGIGWVRDPYADDSFPNFFGCDQQKFSAKSTITINPGVYCDGISLNAGAVVTMNAGIYYIDGGGLSVNGGATLQGSGVTLVFTKKSSNSWPTATINGSATVNLTPPLSGPAAGIVVFGDRNIPVGTTFKFNGGASQYLGGAIYVPTGALQFAGGAGTSTSCTQIIGDTVTFTGNSSLAINCSNYETKPISAPVIKLTF